MRISHPEFFHIHADFCQVLSNPKRLMILTLLGVREMSVGEIAEAIDVPLPNVSQHLAALKMRNIVRSRKQAQNVYYNLVDKRLVEACTLLRTVLLDGMKERGGIASDIDVGQVLLEE